MTNPIMIFKPTSILPSPVLIASRSRFRHIPVSLTGRVAYFTPRTDLSCSRSHIHVTFPKKITSFGRESISLPSNKPSEVDGLGDTTACEDEKEDLSKQNMKKIIKFLEGLTEENEKKIRDLLSSFDEQQKKRLKKISRRMDFIKKVYIILGAQFLLGLVVYAIVTVYSPITNFFKQNYFYLSSLLFIGGSSFKALCSNGKNDFLNFMLLGFFNVTTIVLGVVLANVHQASPKGITMLAALIWTFATMGCACSYYIIVGKSSQLGPSTFSNTAVTISVISSYVQIFSPNSIVAAIDAWINTNIFLGCIVEDTELVLEHLKEDEYIGASACLFLDIYGFFITTIKVQRLLVVLFIGSMKIIKMLFC